MIKRLSVFACLWLSSLLSAHNVIFDFNGVLMGTNTLASLKQIGLSSIMQCMFHLKKSPLCINAHIKSKFFEILDRVALVCAFDQQSSARAYDEMGTALPYLMRTWLDGSMTCSEIKEYIAYATETHPEWFSHPSEKHVICNVINTIFTPQQFVETRTIYQECIRFIKACKKQGHKVFALSNWDRESFALLQKKYPAVFNLFDGIVISADVHALKPSADIYHVLLTRYNLEPHTCWFIDDQQENVLAASALGIHAILCQHTKHKKPNFRQVILNIKKQLKLQRHDQQSVSCA